MSQQVTASIDEKLVRDVLGLSASRPFTASQLGWIDGTQPDTLTFLDSERYLTTLLNNPKVTAAFVTSEFRPAVEQSGRVVIESADPRYDYHALHNYIARAARRRWPSEVHHTAQVHSSAYVAEWNVRVGPNSVIEPRATILEDVEIGRESIVRAGAVLGSEGYEHKRTTRGIVSVVHDGIVLIGDRVEIGSNTCIDKGFRFKPTRIGNDTKIDNLVHIAHSVVLGERCMVVACAMLGGSSVFGDDVWIGPNASVSSVLNVGSKASVTLGAVVTKDVDAGSRVSGNFAVAHEKLLAFIKSIR